MTTEDRVETAEGRFAVRASADSHFGWLRTRRALENTLMAWVRTSISLVSFGFAIVEIFNKLAAMPSVAPPLAPQMPRYIGLMLIAAGVLGLVISVAQYLWISKYLWSPEFRAIAGLRERSMQTPGLVIAVLIALLGVMAFRRRVAACVVVLGERWREIHRFQR